MEALLIVVLVFLLGALGYIAEGFVLAKMWGWFIVPSFGLPQISIPAAIGISVIVGMMTKEGAPDKKEDNDGIASAIFSVIVKVILAPFLVLGIAWIVKQWM